MDTYVLSKLYCNYTKHRCIYIYIYILAWYNIYRALIETGRLEHYQESSDDKNIVEEK